MESRRIFVCPMVSDKMIKQYGLSVAATNFCRNLVAGKMFDEVFTYLTPVVDNADKGYDVNNTIFCAKHWRRNRFTRRFAFLPEAWMMFRRISSRDRVWFYNLPYTLMPLFFLLKWFKPNVQLNLIQLDHTPVDKGLRGLFCKLELWCFNHFDGIITLSVHPGLRLKNKVCLPGVTPNDGQVYNEVESIKPKFLISGVLNDNIAMLPKLMKVFADLPQIELHITGRASNPAQVSDFASRFPNIKYHGMVSYQEYLRILGDTPFLLSTRNPKAPENMCNFPSKIIEGLLHNRIIVSTIHYPQLDGIKYLEIGSEFESMKHDIQYIAELPQGEIMKFANQGAEVNRRFNCNVWKQWMEKIENGSIQ